MKLGELWLIDFGPDDDHHEPARVRPALVVSDARMELMPYRIVVPMTTTRRALIIHVEVEPTSGNALEAVSYVQCELVRTIDKRRGLHLLGFIDPVELAAVQRIIHTLIPR